MIRPRRLALGLLALWQGLLLGLLGPASLAGSQSGWAREPTYRYAGAYRGEWVSDAFDLALSAEPGSGILLFAGRPGHLRGAIDVEVACDGGVRVDLRGQTDTAPGYAALASSPDGLRLLEGRLDLVVAGSLAGRLAARAAEARDARVDAAVEQSVTAPRTGGVALATRWYAADAPARVHLLAGEPGRLRGDWEGVANIAISAAPEHPGLRLGARGNWSATRHTVESCPWQGRATVRGAVVEGQMHEETVELVFRLTPDGRIVGEGRGRARVYGGTPGGCEYSGGGVFAVRVDGSHQGGRFRLHLTDDEQPQLLVTTTCPSGSYVAPQLALATAFAAMELPEATGARGQATVDGSARGVLELSIEPLGEIAPP